MIKIVTDSTCDLPPSWIDRHNITVVPINIQFGLETFLEGVNIDPETFYRRINADGLLPTTSQPSVGQFCEVYKTLSANGSEILSIHLTSKLSGTIQSATLAAQQLQAEANITIFDSLTSSAGLGFMVREAAQLADAGWSAAQIMSRLESRRTELNIFIMLKDLRFARMSGRIGRIRESLASVLKVKPIIGAKEGTLVPLERVRGQKQGLARMIALAAEAVGDSPIHLAVAHAVDRPQAEVVLDQARARLNCQETFITDLSISLAVHFGPGTIGFATYPADYDEKVVTTHQSDAPSTKSG